ALAAILGGLARRDPRVAAHPAVSAARRRYAAATEGAEKEEAAPALDGRTAALLDRLPPAEQGRVLHWWVANLPWLLARNRAARRERC
ncbi:MAG TPA: hypothetical protein VFX98_04980, partial [Longimicrobiaceae bacterium]|nr:hypothetical protein [Longimicrobiaceae bacterium]